jgi:small subunit ribosomal protein S17
MKKEKNKKENSIVKKSKKLEGVVTSTKMKDTIVVSVSRYFKHPKYGKFISRQKKYKVHDSGNTANEGDKVEITECRPISKDKHFVLSQILIKKPIINLDNE